MKTLDSNALDLIQSDFVIRPVVKLRGSWGFVSSDGLRVFDRAAIFKIRGDSCCAKSVAASRGREPGSAGATLNHSENIGAAGSLFGENFGFPASGAEEGSLLFLGPRKRLQVFVEIRFGVMVGRDFMKFSTLFVEPEPRALAVLVVKRPRQGGP